MTGVLSSEWLKIRSVRSTYYILSVASAGVLLAALLAWYAAGYWDAATAQSRHHFILSPTAPVIGWLAQLCLAVLGILAITSEYSTGMIRTSIAAVPRRHMLLAGKASIVGAVALLTGQVIVFATFFISRWIIGDRPLRFWTMPVSHEVPVLLSWGLSVMVFALVGLGLGTAMRSAAGAIVSVVVLWEVLPIVALHLPSPWGRWVAAVMLVNLAPQLSGAPQLSAANDSLLSPMGALVVMAAYVVLALGAGAAVLLRRGA
jgi:ABC-2 type transport system permease protein